jgi:hypothetical protein
MMIAKKSIGRRTVLRGLGASVALPLLDAMVPALTAFQKTPAKPVNRFGAVYVPNGIMMAQWTPAAEGTDFEFTPILKPLEPFRERLLVLSGLNSTPPAGQTGAVGVHARASTRFLTDVPPKVTNGADLEAGISMDQIAAKQLGASTQLASLAPSPGAGRRLRSPRNTIPGRCSSACSAMPAAPILPRAWRAFSRNAASSIP